MNKNPCIHSCWRSSVGHDHAILESFILFVFGTYQWINKQSCVILGCHKQSSEWCHDWFPISLHVPSFSFRARFWIQSLGRQKTPCKSWWRDVWKPMFFESGDKTTHLVAARRRDVVFRATKAASRPVSQGCVASRNFEVQSKLPSTAAVQLSAVQWFSAQR